MTDRPIIFSGPMVRALLDGRKTQTRRVLKPQPPEGVTKVSVGNPQPTKPGMQNLRPGLYLDGDHQDVWFLGPSKFYVGDRLWVKENYQYWDWAADGDPCVRYAADLATAWPDLPDDHDTLEALAEKWAALSDPANFSIDNAARDRKWRPSIHMPRWASRLTLHVTGVKVERLQDISEADAQAEGAPKIAVNVDGELISHDKGQAKVGFIGIWRLIHGPDAWAANPWVVTVTFRVIRANIDSPEAKAAE